MDDNKVTVSIRIDASMMAQLRADAKDENRSLSNYLETLLYRIGYRPMKPIENLLEEKWLGVWTRVARRQCELQS